ncbi:MULTISPECIES: GNAT family N-acetyltransferase [Cytobacillus]|uniref:GNAT family N-acetyltransferase n=1 Tax=Cytobacillus stercorigallinarum TaxID=2762240 RepID=A0ABR8QL80_9BACI|nr:GNAT family N-acetyltransferase [Cytobacillus stercorigallinarum]MBD7936273.1 GNAT family N-acetyltransferase [Cytobacillus stercorigallinarum]
MNIQEIYQLQKICEQHDDIVLKLNLDMIENTQTETPLYKHSIDGQLIGFVALYPFGSKLEICGMVHPSYRRKGIFSSLFTEALPIIDQYEEVLINIPGQSITGKTVMSTWNKSYAFTEYQMVYKVSQPTKQQQRNIHLRTAELADSPFCNQLDQLCFNLSEENAKAINDDFNLHKQDDQLLVICNGNKRVGKIRLNIRNQQLWIYGFAIHPNEQGKGLGSEVLRLVVQQYQAQYSIHLEVEVKNNRALMLYKKCGFTVCGSQDYYHFK